MREMLCPIDGTMVGIPDEALLLPSCPNCGTAMPEADIFTVIGRRLRAAWQILKTGDSSRGIQR